MFLVPTPKFCHDTSNQEAILVYPKFCHAIALNTQFVFFFFFLGGGRLFFLFTVRGDENQVGGRGGSICSREDFCCPLGIMNNHDVLKKSKTFQAHKLIFSNNLPRLWFIFNFGRNLKLHVKIKKNARVTAKVPLKNQKNTIVTSTKKASLEEKTLW